MILLIDLVKVMVLCFFQIKKELVTVNQGSSILAAYYTKLKKCWDEELSVLCSLPSCSCGAAKALTILRKEKS